MPDPTLDPMRNYLRQQGYGAGGDAPSPDSFGGGYEGAPQGDPFRDYLRKQGYGAEPAKPAPRDPNSFETATDEPTAAPPTATTYGEPTLPLPSFLKPIVERKPTTPTAPAPLDTIAEPTLPEPDVKPGDVPIIGQLASFFNPQDPTRVPILGGLAEAISETTRPTTGPGLFDALGQSGGILNEVAANLYSGKDVDPTFGTVAAHELGADKQTAQAIGTAAGYGSAVTGALGGGTNALLNAAMGLERDARDVPLLGNVVRVGEGIMNILAGATNATAGGLIAAGNLLGRGITDMAGMYGAKGGVEGLWAPNSRTQEYLAQLGDASRKVAQGNAPNAQDYILGAYASADPLEQIIATLINPINAIDIVPIGGLQKARGVARATGKVNLLNEAKVFGKTVVPRVVATGENAPLVVRMLFDMPQTVRNEAGNVPLQAAEKLGIRKPTWWEKAMPTVMENKARGYEMLRRSLDNVDARMTDLDAEGFKAFLDNAVTSARTGELSKEFFGKYPQMAAPDAQTAIQLTGGFDVPKQWAAVTKARTQAERMLAEGGTPKEGVWKTAVESLRTNKTLDADRVLDTAAKYDLRTRWGQHVAGSIRDGLGITDRGVIKKMFDGLKSWEGALYIGLNPGSWIRNGWDNQKNLLLYGINPKYDYKKIAATYKDIGWDPFREMDTAAKEGYAKMRQAAAAQPANSYGAFGASVPGKIQELFPWFNNWEQGAQRTAYWSGFDKARRINWRRGNWFKRMPKTLEDALDSISPRMSNLVYGAIEKGHSQKEIYDYINQLHRSVFVESFLDDPEFMRALGGALGASKDLSPESARLVMASHADGINEAIITALSRTDVPSEQALREELAKYRAELVAHHQNLRGQEAPNMRQAAQGAANGTPPGATAANPYANWTQEQIEQEIARLVNNKSSNPQVVEANAQKIEALYAEAQARAGAAPRTPPAQAAEAVRPNVPDAVTPVAPPMTVEQYVDDYMAGKGRGNTPEDLEYQQFAANNAQAIEQEFQRRTASQAVPEGVTPDAVETPPVAQAAPESVTPVEPTSETPAPVQAAPESPVAARQQTIVDNAPAQPPVPEGDFPETDIRRYVYENPALNVVDEGAWDYLIQLKNADGTQAFTPAQLSTWKPETLERIAIERGYASSTYNDFLRLFEKKTGKDAAQSGNYFKNLLNAEIGRKGFFDPEIANIAPFQNWDDVKARPFDAYRLVRGYNEYPTQAEGTFKLQLRLKMIEDQIPDELQQGIETIYDALGATAAKRAGVDVDTWWTQNMAGVEGGTPTSQLRGLAQEASNWYYSQLTRTIENLKQEKFTADQLRGMLKQGGVKADEMKWTGFDDWLTAHPKATKTEALDYLNANQVEIKEVMRGEGTKGLDTVTSTELEAWNEDGDVYVWAQNNRPDLISNTQGFDEVDYETIVDENLWGQTADGQLRPRSRGAVGELATKYSQYTLPGGENYRELLLTLPSRARKESFTSAHWGEPDLLAHIRFNERTTADGKRMLFVEEIQSDWAQAGRDKGFVDTARLNAAKDRMLSIKREMRELSESVNGKINRLAPENNARYQKLAIEHLDAEEAYRNIPGAIPEMPFANSYEELALKRILRYASENGYDSIGWTTGAQQVTRYEDATRAVVDRITVKPTQADGRHVITAYKNGKQVFSETRPADEIAKVIGKEQARKYLDKQQTVFEGNDLTVGGEGMKAAYDKRLVNKMNDLSKKFGGRVGEAQVNPQTQGAILNAKGQEIWSGTRQQLDTLLKESPLGEGEKIIGFGGDTVHAIDITPQMRETAMQGVPLFQKAAGATDFLPDARRLLRFFKGEANASTYVHEAAHVFLPTLDASDLDEVARWTGLTDGAQLRELHMRWVRQDDMGALPNATHKRSKTAYQFRDMDGAISDKERYQIAQEKFARGFEKYLSEGVAPTLALERAFEQFKDFLLEIYRGITGSDIDVKLTDEMRSLYGRMLDADANETGIAKTRLKRLEDASVGEIAPPQVRETGAGELPPQTDEGQYSLFQETDDMPGAMGPNVADAAAEEIRTLDAMLPLIHQSVMDAALKKPVVLDPLTAKALSEYLQKEINPALADSIQASNVIGRWNQSRTVLNYDARTNFDEWLSYVFPFMYWRRAQATNWIQRFMEKPNLLRAYVMAQAELDRMTNSDEYPARLRGKLRLPMPFMDDWMGGSVYFDPLESFLPMQSIYGAELQRAEYSNAGNALLGLPADDGDIAKLLRKKAMRGELSRSDVENAIATQSGEIWEQGKQEARADVASPDNLTGLFTPHAPLQWLVAALTDNTDAIGPLLPLSRPIRSITGAMGMQGGRGVNVEAPIRNLLRGAGMSDLPEFDAWEEYRVIKTLAEMVDDGVIDADTAKLAMMEKSGKAWQTAAQRASATKGNVVNQTLGMLAPTGVFPTGEQGIRQAQKEREALYDSEVVRLGGNPDAMTYDERKQFLTEKGAFEDGQALPTFFDAHPELSAKTAVGQEGEERLKNWMQTAIWKRYNALGDLDKRMVRGQLDKEFIANFLNKDTRDYDSVSLLDLIRAGQQLDAVIPNTPKGESEAMDIARADPRKLATLASPEQNQRYTAFSDKMDAQFDKDAMFRKADEYHALTTDEEKRDYKKRNPDYAAYAKAWAVFNDQNTDILDTLKGVGVVKETTQGIGNSPGAVYAAGVVAIGYPNYDAFKAESETYKALKAKDPDAAKAYLKEHPLLQRAYAFGNALYGDKEKTGGTSNSSSSGASKPRKVYNAQDYVRTVKPSKPRSYGQNQPRLKPVDYWVKRIEAQKRWQQRQPQLPPMPMPPQ